MKSTFQICFTPGRYEKLRERARELIVHQGKTENCPAIFIAIYKALSFILYLSFKKTFSNSIWNYKHSFTKATGLLLFTKIQNMRYFNPIIDLLVLCLEFEAFKPYHTFENSQLMLHLYFTFPSETPHILLQGSTLNWPFIPRDSTWELKRLTPWASKAPSCSDRQILNAFKVNYK